MWNVRIVGAAVHTHHGCQTFFVVHSFYSARALLLNYEAVGIGLVTNIYYLLTFCPPVFVLLNKQGNIVKCSSREKEVVVE